MPSNESCHQYPANHLEEVLEACLWERLGPGWWGKGPSILLVDHLGLFYYRRSREGWERLYGLTHNRLRHLPDRLIYFPDGFKLDLLTGA